MSRFVRISCQEIDDEDDDPAPLTFDVVLDADSRLSHKVPFAGWWGEPRTNAFLRPLVFRPDGIVDFGGDPADDDSERHAEMQLHGMVLNKGTKLYMRDKADGSVSIFLVKKIIDLLNLQET